MKYLIQNRLKTTAHVRGEWFMLEFENILSEYEIFLLEELLKCYSGIRPVAIRENKLFFMWHGRVQFDLLVEELQGFEKMTR